MKTAAFSIYKKSKGSPKDVSPKSRIASKKKKTSRSLGQRREESTKSKHQHKLGRKRQESSSSSSSSQESSDLLNSAPSNRNGINSAPSYDMDYTTRAKQSKSNRKRSKDCRKKQLLMETKSATQLDDATAIDSHPTPEAPTMVDVSANESPHAAPELYMYDSRLEGERCFEWLIHPFSKEKFFSEIWEQKPLLLRRQNGTYYRDLFSTAQLDLILREKCLWFGKNVDVTTYTNGVRETHNPPGRAHAPCVWEYYQNGCSVRILNPQTFARSIWKITATLQDAFGCFVGANVYLTPPDSQGFAPHYDDIEAFILQLEGKKRWRLYQPTSEEELLPRTSSQNLRAEDIGNPVLDVELMAGDLLYFPRGTIHQACTLNDAHSLHLTVSTCQRNTWGDLFEKLVPRMLQLIIKEDLEFRRSLPRDYLNYMGIVHSDQSEKKEESRVKFEEMTRGLLQKMIANSLPLDSAVDQMAKGFVHDALPPLLTKDEKSRTFIGNGPRWTKSSGIVGNIELLPETKVKLLRANVVRLVLEDDGVKIYHSADNTREYHADEMQCIPVSPALAPGVEFLIQWYPKFARIEFLPIENLDSKMELANMLYEAGLLLTEEPVESLDQ